MIQRTQRSTMTYRLIAVAILVPLITLALTGCGGGRSSSQPMQEATFDIVEASAPPVTVDQGDTVHLLASFRSERSITAVFWGTRNDGLPSVLSQSYVWGDNPNIGVRTLYDDKCVPYFVFDEATGTFMTLHWIGSECYLKVYDVNGLLMGGCVLRMGGNDRVLVQMLPDPQVSGTFQTYISDLDAGILTFTVVGTGSRKRCREDFTEGAISRTRSEPDPTVINNYLSALQQSASLRSRQVEPILSAIARDVKQTGTSTISSQIADLVRRNSQELPIHRLMLGLTASQLLVDEAAKWRDRLTKDPSLPQQGRLRVVSEDYRARWYRTREGFISASAQGDPTRVQGVIFAREFGAINLDGIVDAQRRFILSGRNSRGDVVEVTGEIKEDLSQATGSWKWISAERARGRTAGSFSAPRRPLGNCQTQYNSGGQGSFALVYDLASPCGTFDFSYNTYTIPDQIQIFHDGRLIYDSGIVGTQGLVSKSITYNGSTTFVQVIITAPLNGTLWTYQLGCPQ